MKYHYRTIQRPNKQWEIWHIQTQKLIATRYTRREARKLKASLEAAYHGYRDGEKPNASASA